MKKDVVKRRRKRVSKNDKGGWYQHTVNKQQSKDMRYRTYWERCQISL
jgi:hypothetical protein